MKRWWFAGIGLMMASAAQAAEQNLLLSGVEVGGHRNAYGFVGGVTPLRGSTLGNGWQLRGIVSGLTYKYNSGGRNINADAFGGELTMGYQKSSGPGWWAFYTGPVYRQTNLSPNDLSSDARGSNLGWLLQAEGERNFSREFKINLMGNYTLGSNNAFWSRVRLLYKIDGQMYAGPEGIYQGDDDYSSWQLGAGLFGIPLAKDTLLGVKAGIRKTQDFSASPYGGLELGYTF